MQHFRNRSELAPTIKTPTRIKGSGPELIPAGLLRRQVEIARQCLVAIDLSRDGGTCSDERRRIGLLNGSRIVIPRPSVLGGPDLFTLAVSELIGSFGSNDHRSAEERLKVITQKLNDAGLPSGGHVGCKFNAGWLEWQGVIAEHPEYITEWTRQAMGEDYDAEAMASVIAGAQTVVGSGRYEGWNEGILGKVLSAESIEQLAPVDHEGLIVVRNKIVNTTVDQNRLYDQSVIGKGGYVIDDWYAGLLEGVAASGPDAISQMVKARHAHEAIIAAVIKILPNPQLYVTEFS